MTDAPPIPPDDGPCANRHVRIPGPAGTLEALLECTECRRPCVPVAVVCHPHPLYRGTMHNKVVHMVARGLRGIGVHSLRFNFRGVGHSEGGFDVGLGESRDLLAVVDWARRAFPGAPVWLAGFSFGSAIALGTYREAGAERLLLVAPPVEHPYFPRTEVRDIPWMVLMGGMDEVVSPTAVSRWVSRQPGPPEYRYLEPAGHFFHGRLHWLRDSIEQAWAEGLPDPCAVETDAD